MNWCDKHGEYTGTCYWCENEQLHAEIDRLKRGGWISVEERLPEKEGRYFVTDSKEVGEGVLLDGKLYACDSAPIFTEDITHWMPLPEPPKEGEKG
jgi:Protein of unknown function (DUF551).